MDKKSYLLSLSRYIHLNPLNTRNPEDPVSYEGSSLKYYINGGEPSFLDTQEILSFFKGKRKKYAKIDYHLRKEKTDRGLLEIIEELDDKGLKVI